MVWRHTRRNLTDFFDADTPFRDITEGDAVRFRLYLVGQKLASTTVAKRLQFARQFFDVARKDRLINENPFRDLRHKSAPDPARKRFITHEETIRLLEAAPNIDWRVIIALCRYGGLRCPAEVLSMKWDGADWERRRIRIDSPKTEHHPGKAFRIIPMFPKLEPILAEAWELAPERALYVVGNDAYRKAAQGEDGWVNCNIRTQFTRIVLQAGLEPWPKLFHNLRASRETELMQEHAIHVVTEWLGNTPSIAMRHYLQVTDSIPTVSYKLWPNTFELLKVHRSKHLELALTNRKGTPLKFEEIINRKVKKIDNIRSAYNRVVQKLKIPKADQKPLKLLRKTAASKLGEHPEFGKFAQYFLGHSPRTIADKHYVRPNEEQFDRAVTWLGEQFGVGG